MNFYISKDIQYYYKKYQLSNYIFLRDIKKYNQLIHGYKNISSFPYRYRHEEMKDYYLKSLNKYRQKLSKSIKHLSNLFSNDVIINSFDWTNQGLSIRSRKDETYALRIVLPRYIFYNNGQAPHFKKCRLEFHQNPNACDISINLFKNTIPLIEKATFIINKINSICI
jgi:hypothetical protein